MYVRVRTSAASAAFLLASPASPGEVVASPGPMPVPVPVPSVRGGPPTFLGTVDFRCAAGAEPRTRPGGEVSGSSLPQMLPMARVLPGGRVGWLGFEAEVSERLRELLLLGFAWLCGPVVRDSPLSCVCGEVGCPTRA